MRLTSAIILVFGCLLVATYVAPTAELLALEDQQIEKVPKDARAAERALTKWLNGFKAMTSDEVREALGDPANETVWLFEEKREPLLEYKVGNSTTLSLYFHRGRVVKAALHLLP